MLKRFETCANSCFTLNLFENEVKKNATNLIKKETSKCYHEVMDVQRKPLVDGVKPSNITLWDANISLYCIRRINATRSEFEKTCWDMMLKKQGKRLSGE